MFALPAPLRPGTVISAGGPGRPSPGGQAALSSAPVVATAQGPSWFFYQDLAPYQQYSHPGRVALVNVRTGHVLVSRRISWPPLLNGTLPAFLASESAYDGPRYRLLSHPYTGTGGAIVSRLSSREARGALDMGATLDPSLSAVVAGMLAEEHACAIRFSDRPTGGYYAFARVAQSRAALGYRFAQLAALAPGFRSSLYPTVSGVSPVTFLSSQIAARGCQDVLLYAAGGGYAGTTAVNIGMGLTGGKLRHEDLTLPALRVLVASHPNIHFELVLDAPHSSAFQALAHLRNVLLVATPRAPGGGSFTYLPEALIDGKLLPNRTDPLHLLELTGRLAFGLDAVIRNAAEVAQIQSLSRAGRLPSAMAYLLARAFDLGAPVDFPAVVGIGSPPQLTTNGFSFGPPTGTLPPTAPPARAPTVPPGVPVVTANPDTYATSNASPLTVSAANGVLANDTDSAHNPLTVDQLSGVAGTSPLHGMSAKGAAVTLNADGSFIYDPTASPTLQALGAGQSTTDNFTYRANDGHGGTATGTVTITVTGIDRPPTVTGNAPLDGASAVLATTAPSVTFDKPVNVSASAFKLECPTGTPEPFTLSPSPPGGATTFTLTPISPLPAGVTCTVTVSASQVTDLAGTGLGSDYVFSFTVDTPPTVSSTTPANGATNVLATTAPSVTFSKPVNVSTSAFKLECPTGTPEPFTLSPSPPGGATTFTLTPSSPLPAGTVCTVTTVASHVTDLAGTGLGSDYVFSFTVDAPPTVSSTTPANGATSVLATTAPSVTFDKPVNVSASAFTLECPTGTPEPFTLSPSPPGGATTFTLTPSSPLPAGTVCTVTTVASHVTDLAGTGLDADHSFSFTVDTPPTVSSTTPANGATSVLATTAPSVTFDKPVNVSASAFTLECPTGTPEPFTLSPSPPGGATTFTLTPSSPLPAGTVCTVTTVASHVTDLAGTGLDADHSFSFTVDTPPTVSSTTPANGATSVLATTAPSVTFDKPVNVSASAFTLECPTGTPEPFTLSPSPPGGATTFTLTPSSPLPAGVTCTVTVSVSQVTDLAGTGLDADHSFSFTVDTPPTVSSTTPANGATSVLATTAPSVTFDKPVNVSASAFTLECPTGTPEPFTLSPSPPGGATTFTLTPSSPLPAGVTCTVTVSASQVTDLAGTGLDADHSFSFTVDTPPTVSSTTPANGATSVLATTAPSVTFDKPVNVSASAFTLECPTGTPEPFTLSPSPPGGATTFTLTPSSPLPAGSVCTVTAVASQITDTAGTGLGSDYVFSFTVDTPPTVSNTVPANGATSVLATTAPSVTFDKPVNVSASAFKLECPTGTPEPFTLSPSPPGGATTFTLTPSSPLPAGTVCTVTVVASQVADLAGTNLAADYVLTFTTVAAPIAHDYTVGTAAVGNTLFVVGSGTGAPGGPSVTDSSASDSAFGHVTNPGVGCPDWPATLTLPSSSTANGGTVQMVGSGSNEGNFYYQPPVGFTGTDTFQYTATDSCGSSTATVSISVQNKVWYVNDNDASNGNGTSTSPFNALSSVSGTGNPSGTGDYIFLFGSSTSYTGGITLKASQTLVSQSFGLTVNGQTVVAASGANPTITNSGGDGVTVAEGDTIDGITVANTSGNGVSASSVNSFTLDSSDVIQNTTGDALAINGGNGTITDGAAITTATSGGHSISIQNRTGGTITNRGSVTDSGKGILLSSNTGAEIDFTGKLAASTGANTAFNATGGGTVNVTGASNTLRTTTGTALNVQNTNVGSSGLTFRSISAGTTTGSSGDGIVLDTTGSSGGLTVTGNSSGACGGSVSGSTPSLAVTAPSSADCTGGVIQHKTGSDGSTTSGIGIYLNNTAKVSLTRMWLHDFDNFGISGSGVSDLTISNSLFNGSNGTNQNGSGEGAVYFFGLSGSTSVTNSFFSGGALDSFHLENDGSQVLNRITFTGDNFGDTLNATSASALFMQADCTAQLKATVDTSVFTAARSNNLNVSVRGQSNDDLVVSNSQFSNSDANQVSGGSNLAVGAGGPSSGCADNTLNPTLTYNIHNNAFRDALGTAVSISKGGVGTGTFGTTANPGIIDSNAFGVSGNSTSSGAGGIGSILVGGGSIMNDITNNTIHGAINAISIGANSSVAGGGQGFYRAVLQGNNVDTPNVGAGNITNGLLAQFGAVSTDDSKVCLTLGGSTAALKNNLDGGRNGGADLRLRVRFGTLIGINGYSGANNDDAAMTSFLDSQNVFGTAGAIVTNNAATGSGWTGTCPT